MPPAPDPVSGSDSKATERTHVILFSDGACRGNPGPGGWAYILRDPRTGRDLEGSGGDPMTTNNRMELLSVINGLKTLKKPCTVEIVSDSQYVVKGLAEWMDGWKKKGWRRGKEAVKNLELWQELDRQRGIHTLRPRWIRGHTGHPENERCDQLAVAAAERAATG